MSIKPMQTSMHLPQPVHVTSPYLSREYSYLQRSRFSSRLGRFGREFPPPPVRAYPIERHVSQFRVLSYPPFAR